MRCFPGPCPVFAFQVWTRKFPIGSRAAGLAPHRTCGSSLPCGAHVSPRSRPSTPMQLPAARIQRHSDIPKAIPISLFFCAGMAAASPCPHGPPSPCKPLMVMPCCRFGCLWKFRLSQMLQIMHFMYTFSIYFVIRKKNLKWSQPLLLLVSSAITPGFLQRGQRGLKWLLCCLIINPSGMKCSSAGWERWGERLGGAGGEKGNRREKFEG